MITEAPRRDRACAMPAPMPFSRPEPVISATLPAREVSAMVIDEG